MIELRVCQETCFSKLNYLYRNKDRSFALYLEVEQADNNLVFKQPNSKKDRVKKVWDFPSSVVKIVPKGRWAFMSKRFFPMVKHWEHLLKVHPENRKNRILELIFQNFAGDEIFSINGTSVSGLTHQEAIAMFKEVKQGQIVVTIGRRTPAKKKAVMITASQEH